MTTKTAQFTPLISEVMAHYNLSDDEWDCLSSFTKQKLSTVYAKHAAAPAMYEALETVPLPKHNEAIGEFYTRFYTWYEGQVKQALAQAEGRHHE